MGINTAAVQRLYVAYFNRPADPVGLAYWESKLSATVPATQAQLTALAAGFSGSQEYADLYAGQSNTQIINSLYQNLFGRDAEPAGLIYWAGQLSAGTQTFAQIALQLTFSAQGTDATAIANKLAAATAFTTALDTTAEIVGYSGTDAAASARTWLATVTDVAATLTAAIAPATLNAAVAAATVTGTGVVGQTYTLTAGVDNIVGTVNNDTIKGFVGHDGNWNNNLSTLTTFDEINGGAGIDTLDLVVNADYTMDHKMSNVEIISARVVGGTTASIDFANISGVTTVEIKDTNSNWGSIDGGNVSDAISTYKFTNVARLTDSVSITMEFNNDVFTGTNDAINVVLDKAGNSTNGMWANLELSNNNWGGPMSVIEVLNVESKGSDNQFSYEDRAWWGPSVLKTVNVTGTAALNLVIDNQDVLATVNAATFNGGLTFNGWSDVDMSVTTGAGKDVIDLQWSNKNNTISTGAGNDIIVGGWGKDTINAGAGDDDIDISKGGIDTVNAGAGNDIVRVGGSLATGDLLDGGDGVDTLAMSSAAAVAASALTGTDSTAYQALFSNFETLVLGTVLAGNIDLAKLDSMQTLVLSGGVDGDRTITGLSSNATVVVKAAAVAAINNTTITVTGAATGTTDVLNLTLNAAGSADYGVITAAAVETLNLVSTTSNPTPADVINTVDLGATAHTTLNISGNTKLDLGGVALTSVKTVAGSAFNAGLVVDLTGNANATTVTLGNGANTVTGGNGIDTITTGSKNDVINGGAGNDIINAGDGINNVNGGAGNDSITTGAGNDTINAGNGNDTINAGNGVNTIIGGTGLDTMTGGTGVDTYIYWAVGDSQGVTVDVITNFAVGATGDILDLSAVKIGTATFAGTASGYGAVLTSLIGDGFNSQAVFDSSTSTLYIDIDGSGTLDNADMAIQLTGVTTGLVAANFDFVL